MRWWGFGVLIVAEYLVTMGRDFLDRVLIVVYTERGEDEIRLISARKASPGERKAYAGGANP